MKLRRWQTGGGNIYCHLARLGKTIAASGKLSSKGEKKNLKMKCQTIHFKVFGTNLRLSKNWAGPLTHHLSPHSVCIKLPIKCASHGQSGCLTKQFAPSWREHCAGSCRYWAWPCFSPELHTPALIQPSERSSLVRHSLDPWVWITNMNGHSPPHYSAVWLCASLTHPSPLHGFPVTVTLDFLLSQLASCLSFTPPTSPLSLCSPTSWAFSPPPSGSL